MPKVFISYARDESHGQNLATECQQELQTAGFEVFRDVIGLKPGDVWYSKLEFELETSDVVVLVVSEKVRRSKWVHNEISMAEEIGLPVIPVFAEAVRSPLWLRHLQVLDFALTTNWPELIEAIYTKGKRNAELSLGNESVPSIIPSISIETPQASEIFVKPKPVIATPNIKNRLVYQCDQYRENLPWASEVDIDDFGIYADLDIGGSGVLQRFRLIQPGTFWMGSLGFEVGRCDDETRRKVTFNKGFWLADTACTQLLWETVMGNNPSEFKDSPNNPVEQVGWNDIQQFIQKLNIMQSGLSVQIPTEAQWEYACRAGADTPFSFGSNISPLQVNYNGDEPYAGGEIGIYRQKTVSVKSLEANAWGLYEMHGNVWEWCYGIYKNSLSSEASIDSVNEPNKYRVLRGGSWIDGGDACRSAQRLDDDSFDSDYDIGFRLSLSNKL